MATPLNKTKMTKSGLRACNVVRELSCTDIKRRPLICELSLGDEISFRPKGTRVRFSVHLLHVYYMAMNNFLEERYQEKIKEYNRKRSAGIKAKRPKRYRMPQSPTALQALAMKR